MLIRRRLMLGALAAVLFAAPIINHAQQPADAPAARVLDVAGGQIRVVTVATGLFHPWSLAFLPDGGILVSERNGRLRLIRDGKLLPETVWTSPTPAGEAADSAALRRRASEVCRERARLRLVSETGTAREHARGRARTPERRHARRGPGNLRRRRLGDERQHRGPHHVRARPDALRHGRRSRSALLHGHRRQQPPDEGAGARQPRRQNAAPERRRRRCRRTTRSSARPGRSRRSSRTATATDTAWPSIRIPGNCGRPRSARWAATRSTSSSPGTTTDGRSSRRAATTRARSCPISRGRGRAWTTRGSTGCRRSARRASCSTRATSSRNWKNNLFVGALTTRQLQRIAFGQPSQAERREAAAPAAEHPRPRRPAEPRRLHLRRHRTGERPHRRRRDGAADRAYRRSRCTVKRTGTCDSARLSVINVKLMTFPSTVPL